MSDGLYYEKEITCECGAEHLFTVEWPPIPAVVVRFTNDEGREIGECHCGRDLVQPEGLPAPGAYRGAEIREVLNMLPV